MIIFFFFFVDLTVDFTRKVSTQNKYYERMNGCNLSTWNKGGNDIYKKDH